MLPNLVFVAVVMVVMVAVAVMMVVMPPSSCPITQPLVEGSQDRSVC